MGSWRGRVGLLLVLVVVAAACTNGESSTFTSETVASNTTDPSIAIVDDAGAATPSTTAGTADEVQSAEAEAAPLEQAAALAPPGFYVSPMGNDGNDGLTPDTAFATIASAVKRLGPGDTLWVLDGEYIEDERTDSAIVVDRSGTEDAWIRIAAFPGANPVIRTDHKNGMKIEGASYVEVRGLTFVGTVNQGLLNSGREYSGAGINVDAIFSPQRNHHVRIIGNTISGYGAGGIPVTGTSHVEIRDNVIFNVAKVDVDQHSGISILEPFNIGFGDDDAGYSNYITGNVVYDVENLVRDRKGRFTDGNCVILDRTTINDYQGRTLVANNLCIDNGGRGVQIYQSTRVDVVNNTLFGNSKTGEIAERGGDLGAFESRDIRFANNLVFTTGAHSPARASQSSDVSFANNVYVSSREAQYGGHSFEGDQWINDGSALVADAGTTPDPARFALLAGSAAIDAGTDEFIDVVGRDHSGRSRTIGDMPDAGAFEFAG